MKNSVRIAGAMMVCAFVAIGLVAKPARQAAAQPTTKPSSAAATGPSDPAVEIADATTGKVLKGDQTVIVGQQIALKAKVTPANTVITAHKWTIGGTTVLSYTQTPTKAEKKDLEGGELQKDNVTFYWIAGAPATARVQVKCEATIDGRAWAAPILGYEVKRPTFALTSKLPGANPKVGVRENKELRFGEQGVTPGIIWNGVVAPPAEGAGKFMFVQLYSIDEIATPIAAGALQQQRFSARDFCLDNSGEPHIAYLDFVGDLVGGQDANGSLEDLPYVDLADNVNYVCANNNASLYLMYKSSKDKSIWVTLGRLDWYWRGAAKKTGDKWTKDAFLNADDFPSPAPVGVDSVELPLWRRSIGNVKLQNGGAARISNIVPATGSGSAVDVVVTGRNFTANTLIVVRRGETEKNFTGVTFIDDKTIGKRLNLTGVDPGVYDVEVRLPTQIVPDKLPGGFKVTAPP